MRQVVRVFWITLICGMFWIALAAWTVASPVGASPDEDFHQTMIYCAAKNDIRCNPDGQRIGHCYSMRPFVAANCSQDAGLDFPAANKVDWGAYPPVYYKTMSLFLGNTLGKTTIYVRLVNVTLAIFVALMSVALTSFRFRRAVAVSWVVSSVPVGVYFISSINPTAWSIISIAGLWGPLLTLLCDRQASSCNKFMRNAINLTRFFFVSGVVAIGLGSRSEPYLWIPLVFGVVFLYWFVGHKRKLSVISKVFVFGFVASAFFLLLINVFEQPANKAQILLLDKLFPVLAGYFSYSSWDVFQRTVNSIFGVFALTGIPGSELGTHDVPTPSMASFFITISFGGAFLLGLSSMDKQKTLVLSLTAGILFFVVSLLWSAADWDVYQSRYFLPFAYFIFGLALLPAVEKDFYFNRVQWFLVLLSSSIANSLMLLSTELRFLYGVVFQSSRYPLNKDAPDIALNRLFDAPIPNWWLAEDYSPFHIWVIGSITFLLAVSMLYVWLVRALTFNQGLAENPNASIMMRRSIFKGR